MHEPTHKQPVQSISPHDHTFPALDGLRGLAVALVLLVHFAYEAKSQLGDRPGVVAAYRALDPLISMGGTGVHLFFVLSGFLLFLPFARHVIAGRPRPSRSRFFKRRALRILPAYYVIVTLTALLFERDAVAARPVAQVVSHLFLVHNYSHETFKGINGPTWTMAVESQFYVMLPFLALAGAWCAMRSRWLAGGALLLLLAVSPLAAVIQVLLRRIGVDPTFTSAFSFLSVFACGMLAACVFVLAETGRIAPSVARRLARTGGATFVVVFGGLVARQALAISTGGFDYYFYAPLMGACYLGLLLHVLLRPTRAGSLLSRPGPRFVGDISYSVYLVHYPLFAHVVMPLARHVPNSLALPVAVLLGAILVLASAFVSFRYVERPFLEKKQAARPAPETSPAGAATGRANGA